MRGEKSAQMAPANDEKRLDEIGGGELTAQKNYPAKKYVHHRDRQSGYACVCVCNARVYAAIDVNSVRVAHSTSKFIMCTILIFAI